MKNENEVKQMMKKTCSEQKPLSYGEWKNNQPDYISEKVSSSVNDRVEAILEKSRSNDCYYMEEDLY